MINTLKKLPEHIKTYIPLFIGCMVFSTIIYFLLMANQLVNPWDGLWEYSYYTAGYWELSLGRWAWLYLDQLRLGISVDPLTSLISIALFSIGIILVVDMFELAKTRTSYIVCALFLSNASICIALSYRYMSPTFGASFLLNILAVWILVKVKNNFITVPVSALLIAAGMGMYQANIGCACVCVLGYWIYCLLGEEKSLSEILKSIARFFIAAALGAVLYVLILNVHLNFFHTALSGYNGANTYSIGNTIRNLPGSIVRAYITFRNYFVENIYITTIFQKYKIYLLVFICFLILFIAYAVKNRKANKCKTVIAFVFLLAMPIACNAVTFIATATGTSMQMTTPLALCVPVLLCIVGKKMSFTGAITKWLYRISYAVLLLVLYGSIYQVQLDQNAMLEGKVATKTLATEMVYEIHEAGYPGEDMQVCVVGLPVYSDLFKTSPLYDMSNLYARFGNWWTDPGCSRRSWQGVFSYLCGTDIEMCSVAKYNELAGEGIFAEMPVFPQDGSIIVKDNVIIIKVSE